MTCMLHKVAHMTATPWSLIVEYPGRTDLNKLCKSFNYLKPDLLIYMSYIQYIDKYM